MANYDGETVRIKVTVTDYDDTPVTGSDVSSAVIDLYDSAGNYVFRNQALTWLGSKAYWYFDWQAALPGTFTSVSTFTGANFEVFEYGTVRVKPLKVTPTGQPTPITGQEDNNGG